MDRSRHAIAATFISFFLSQTAIGKVDRISEQSMDLSKPMKIRMTPGRSSVLEFPCKISHTILGLDGDVKTTIGPDNKESMALWLSGEASKPTNIIVKCEGQIFVFDIVPTKHSHQDYVVIEDVFDSRRRRSRKLIDSSSRASALKAEPTKLKLIASSSDKVAEPIQDQVLKALNKRSKTKKLIYEVEKR